MLMAGVTAGLLLAFAAKCPAEQPPAAGKPVGGVRASLAWQTDSIRVGQPTPVRLHLSYPDSLRMILPAEEQHFKPYTVQRKEGPRRNLIGARTHLWVTYWVVSFEVDSLQSIQLPYFVPHNGDTLQGLTPRARIPFHSLVGRLEQDLGFQRNRSLASLQPPVNWLWWGTLAGGLLAIMAGLFLLLRRPVLNYLKRRRLQKQLNAQLERLRGYAAESEAALELVNAVNALWKRDLEHAWHRPLRSLTYAELREQLEAAGAHLTAEDRGVLQELGRLEERLNYARASVEPAQLRELARALEAVLLHEYQARFRRVA
jgi:hypothetical protein